jgi:hypothetical protein
MSIAAPLPLESENIDICLRERRGWQEHGEREPDLDGLFYYLKERLKEWPVKACLELLATSPVTTTRVVAIASMPSVTEVMPYSRRTVGICRHSKSY